MNTSITPLPWRAFTNAGPVMQGYSQSAGIAGTGDYAGRIICGCFKDIGGTEIAAAHAEFIVKACNAHDELKDLCGTLAQIVYTQNGNQHADINELLSRARIALAKVDQ